MMPGRMSEPTPLEYRSASAVSSEATPLQKISWVLYDWANSGYGLVVISAVFPTYLIQSLLPLLPGSAEERGLVIGSLTMRGSAVSALLTSLSMLLMAIAAPVLGAVADIKGWTKRLLIISGVTGSLLTMVMFFLRPGDWLLGAVLFVASNFCFGTSFAFYSAFLPKLTRPEKQGSLSGWGFAAGYIGGAVALVINLMMIRANSDYVRHGLALSGLWWLVFALPAYFTLDELPPQATEADRGPLLLAGFRRIAYTFRNIRQYRMLFLFLAAFLLYNDGVETVIAVAGPYGTDELKMTAEQIIVMFLIVQGVAFVGAVGFGYLADRIGNKPVIVINLVVWVVAGLLAYFVQNATQFTLLAILVGAVLGGVQASSRALMALLAPEKIRNEAFGFFSISGKFASILGPFLYAGLSTATGSPKIGILSVLPFMIVGLLLLLPVREPGRHTATNGTNDHE